MSLKRFLGMLNSRLTYSDTSGQPVRFLSIDEFDDELQLANCGDGSIKITLNEEVDFDSIMRDWAFINEHGDNHVMFITTSQQCDRGFDQPWIVSGARFDDTANAVMLVAEPREFKDLPYQAYIEVSSQGKPLPRDALVKREDEPTESEEYSKPGDINFDVDIPEVGLAIGSGGNILKSLTGKPPDVTLACMNCSLHGSLDFDLSVKADLNSKTKFSGGMTLKAKDVGATIRLLLSVNSVLKDALNVEQPVFGFVPSGPGLYFGKIVDIGPPVILMFRLSIGGNEVPVAFESGFDMSIDPDAEFKLDFADPTSSDASGWQPNFEALQPRLSKGDYTLHAQAGPRLQFVIAGKVLGTGAEAGFDLGGGNIQFGLTQGQDREDCGHRHSPRGRGGSETTHSSQTDESSQTAQSSQATQTAQAAKGAHKNGTFYANGAHDGPGFLEFDIGIVNEIKAFADANFFGASAYAGHALASSSKQLTKTYTELPRTTKFLEMNTNLITPSINTFEATEFVGKAISKINSVYTDATSTVESVYTEATDGITSATDAVSSVASEGIATVTSAADEFTDKAESGWSEATDFLDW